MHTVAASTAQSQPNSAPQDSRNTNASDTERLPLSSSGTGLSSATVAARAKIATPASSRQEVGEEAAVQIAPTTTGIETPMTALKNRRSGRENPSALGWSVRSATGDQVTI